LQAHNDERFQSLLDWANPSEMWHAASFSIQLPARYCELANNPELSTNQRLPDYLQAHNDERGGLISVDIFIS
jgi:hypothetical protein